jgi:hypothetical protein
LQALRCYRSNGNGFKWLDEEMERSAHRTTIKPQSPSEIDKLASGTDLAEVGSFCSDSEMGDDLDDASEISRYVLDFVRETLRNHRGLILNFFKEVDMIDAGFSSRPAEQASRTRRHGSPLSGPPRKRQSTQSYQPRRLPDRDGNGESGGEEDPNERRGNGESSQSAIPSSCRMFACPFYQREPTREWSQACQGPGWPQFFRVK